MMFETCEMRRMMAVTADAFHNTLYVWGDANANGISVEKSGSDLVVKKYTSGVGYSEIFRKADSYVNHVRIYGYDGADTITIADNVTDPATIMGGRGADYLKAGGGQSNVYGHGDWSDDPSGSHKLSTDDSAADNLVSGAGYSILHGQKGNDSFYTTYTGAGATTQYDVMNGGDGNDNFYTTGQRQAYAFGQNGNDTFYAGKQRTLFSGGAGSDTIDFANFGEGVYVRPDGVGYSGENVGSRKLIIQTDVEIAYGTNYNDYFSGSDNANIFFGRKGVDSLFGNAGNDVLNGGDNGDYINGGNGNDIIIGEAGNDSLYGGSHNDSVYGGLGTDDIHGGSGNDHLYGQEDGDWIYGDSGNDLMVGGAGADFLDSHDGVVANDILYGDNTNGTGGGGGVLDVAFIDRIGNLLWQKDATYGFESVAS